MSKLFTAQETLDIRLPFQGVVALNDISDFEAHTDGLQLSTEAFKTASNNLKLISGMMSSLDGKDRSSGEYFQSLETYSLMMETIADNLGVKHRIPSLEDFKNPYGTEACHQITMEGFYSFIKTIWQKIKDIFAAFFKKVSLFFKRLMGANLNLEEYNKYLDPMISELKVKNATLTDNTVLIESKLPSMLANPGMEKIDSNFLFTTGKDKLDQLTEMVNGVFGKQISEIAKTDMKEIHNKLRKFIDKSKNAKNIRIEDIKDLVHELKTETVSSLGKLFPFVQSDIRGLPDDVFDAIQAQYDRNEIDGLVIRSLNQLGNFSQSLPKNFNGFYILSEQNKMYITTTSQADNYTTNQLNPIGTLDNLVGYHQLYKKFCKQLNTQKLKGDLDDLSDVFEDIMDLMKGKFVDSLDALTSKGTATDLSYDDAVKVLQKYLMNIYKEYDNNPDQLKLFRYRVEPIMSKYGINDDSSLTTYLKLGSGDSDSAFIVHSSNSKNKDNFIKFVIDTTGVTSVGSSQVSAEDLKELVKTYEDLQKFMLNFFNSTQTALSQFTRNLVGVHTELQYEMAKYIYNTARLYSA